MTTQKIAAALLLLAAFPAANASASSTCVLLSQDLRSFNTTVRVTATCSNRVDGFFKSAHNPDNANESITLLRAQIINHLVERGYEVKSETVLVKP